MNHTQPTIAGIAKQNSMTAKNFHALKASRQFPPVMPSTQSGTTSVQPVVKRAAINQGAMRDVT